MDSATFDRICAIIQKSSRSQTESGRLELLNEAYRTEPVPVVLEECCRKRRDEFASCITRQAPGFSLSDGQNVLVRLLGILRRDFGAQDQAEVDVLIQWLRARDPAAIEHYLSATLEAHLKEVMPNVVFAGLKKAFVDAEAELRRQLASPLSADDDVLDEDLFPIAEWEAEKATLQFELAGELHPPREGRYSPEGEYTHNVRERLRELRRAVILGEPGAGKTFLLGRLALDSAQAYREKPGQLLPVFVPLSKYDSAEAFKRFVAQRMGTLGQRIDELPILWLLDALNEMPREKGQLAHLKKFVDELVSSNATFVLSCRVRNYDEDLHNVQDLYRVDLQDLNPQQIYDILRANFHKTPEIVDYLWNGVMHGDGLLEAWAAWAASVREFWERPDPPWRIMAGSHMSHLRSRYAVHKDPRKLMLLCRNPFTLVRLLLPRIGKAAYLCAGRIQQLGEMLERELPNNRAALFGALISDMLQEEAKKQSHWDEPLIAEIQIALEFTAAALQATEQRTELLLADLTPAPEALRSDLTELLKMGRDAGLVSLTETSVRFNHQLFQEYFATKRLGDLLAAYEERHPGWYEGPALPTRDENLAELFPNWWDAGGWGVTVALLGEVEGATWISRVVRWLASYAPEIALQAVLDNNDGRKVTDLTPEAKQALILSAQSRIQETDPRGRAAAYRVLGHPDLDADLRPGVGTFVRADRVKLPDIEWVHIPAGDFSYQNGTKRLDYDYWIARYPITYAQFQTFFDDPKGYGDADRWFEGLAVDEGDKQMHDQWFKFRNHPRENVSWYDSIAFCRWLSWRLGGGIDLKKTAEWVVRLPTEMEWEKAARAQTGWDYPWGSDYEEGYANIAETATEVGPYDLRKTSAVGIYPQGEARHWEKPISDLSGNVWEWCLRDCDILSDSDAGRNLVAKFPHMSRGGSWGIDQDRARAVYRELSNPRARYINLGFRMILVRP